ncbi:MAG: helix-turn-helix transcriptional regulator [Acinetobacter venetianus]|uniref:helix-turn-helix transcriptional regulator n=1 Tax=Acinetobacter venetianus TaxID=52133 RepID=UPI0035BE7307
MYYQSEQLQSTIRSIKYKYKNGIVEPVHQHQVCQFIYIKRGVIRVYAQNRCWVIVPSRGLLIPAGIPHSLLAVGNVELRALYIHPEISAEMNDKISILQVSPLLSELINSAAEFEDVIIKGSREERINQLILDELSLMESKDFNVVMPLSAELKVFCERVSNNYDRPWELADVASSLGVSVKTISRKFHLETGLSFGEWLRCFRLLKSMELMASGYSVTDAALAVGYDSQSSFSITFKKRVGISPKFFVSHPKI